MKVKEIIIAAAKLLGLEQEAAAYFNGGGADNEDMQLLLDCFNEIENELALDYFPLVTEEKKSSVSGQFGYSDFNNVVSRVLRVTDEYGNAIPFKLYARYMTTQPGGVVIVYTYSPKSKGFYDDSDFVTGVSERLFAYGIAAAYTMVKGLYEECAIWDKKYKDAIAYAGRTMRSKQIKGRVWV